MAGIMPRRMLIASTIALLGGAAVLSGCVIVVGGKGWHSSPNAWSAGAIRETRTLTLDHLPGADLDIATPDGSIEVRRHGGSSVEIEARLRAADEDRLDEIAIVAQRDADGALRIRPEWPRGVRRSGESCSFLVLIPDAGAIRLESSDGSLGVFGVGTSIDAETDDGSIELRDVKGPVTATTDDGSIALHQGGPRASFRLRTDDGSVRVELHPGFAGSLQVTTDDGGINFRGLDALDAEARLTGVSSRRMTLVAGASGPESSIHTNDGAVTLSVLAIQPSE